MTVVNDRDLHHAARQLGDPHLSVPGRTMPDVRYVTTMRIRSGTEVHRIVTIPFDVPGALFVNYSKIMLRLFTHSYIFSCAFRSPQNSDVGVGAKTSAKTTTA